MKYMRLLSTLVICLVFALLLSILFIPLIRYHDDKHISLMHDLAIRWKLTKEPVLKADFIRDIIRYTEDEQLGTVLVANSSAYFDGWNNRFDRITKVEINSLGLRDDEISIEKPSETFRILVLGDSFTFGFGLEHDEIYTEILEKKIKSISDSDVEVVNLGVPGYAFWNMAEQYKTLGKNLSPDLVIIGITLANEFKIENHGAFETDCNIRPDICKDLFENNLRLLLDEISVSKVPTIAVFIVNDHPRYEEMVDYIDKLSGIYDLYFLSVRDPLNTLNTKERCISYPDDCHNSPAANNIIAVSIFDYLLNENFFESEPIPDTRVS